MRLLLTFCLALGLLSGATDVNNGAIAARLARQARKARNDGQIVRAYLLFAEASARDPRNPTYSANRDALAPAANLLTKADIESANVSSDIVAASKEQAAHPGPPPIERINVADWESNLKPVPKVTASTASLDLSFEATPKSLAEQVGAAYGVKVLVDSDIPAHKPIHFEMHGADFRTALEGLTAATNTFVFPVTSSMIYFAPDTQLKRDELEPVTILTFPLQEALTEKDLIEAANAVRTLLRLRTIGWDSFNRMVVIRDRATRALVARSLLESLLLPRGQVSFDVQFMTVDTDRNYHYGVTLQTLFQFIDFGGLGGLKNVLPAAVGPTQFLSFGGGATLFGIGVADAMSFATYTNSWAQVIFDSTVVVGDRQTANFHFGDKYPIASSLYTGFSQQGGGSLYDPAPQITLEDLGLVLKVTPHINGSGDVDMEIEAEFRSLGNQTFNTVPSINERSFKGTVSLREGEWAILAGIDSSSHSVARNGLAGLSQIPGLNQILSETTRDSQTSNTLLVIKPTITRLPMTGVISPQYLLGQTRGERVLI